MLKAVIIDDEPIIVEGLTKLIPWGDYGCEIAGTANDGREGSELIRRISPDIVITDIAMPGLDGLTMIAGLRSEFPDLQVSILTGYRDFDYAQEAIRLGVTRFMLKPSNMDELIEAVAEMVRRCGQSTKQEDAGGTSAAGSFTVGKAVEYINAHYKERLTLADVADKVYVSQWHLSKLLNKHLSKSFLEILNQARIDAAKKLLEDPSFRISDVAWEVGFLDFAHFSRVFKKMTGVSPNGYRNSL